MYDASTRAILITETKIYLQFSGRKILRRSSTASWYTKLQLIKLLANCWYRLKNFPVTFELWSGNAIFAGHSRVQRTFGTKPKKRPDDARRRPAISMHYRIIYLRTANDLCTLYRALRNMSLHCALPVVPDVQRTGMRSWINIDSRRHSPFIWNKDTRW